MSKHFKLVYNMSSAVVLCSVQDLVGSDDSRKDKRYSSCLVAHKKITTKKKECG